MRTVIAIPAYNCAAQITRVLDEIPDAVASRVDAIWVVDNRSTDDTAERAADYAATGRLSHLRVLRALQNNNLGGTHKLAFDRARAEGFTHVVVLHGDNQAKSAEVALLLDQLDSDPGLGAVLGSRFDRRSTLIGYDWKRIWGNRVLNVLYSAVTLRRCADLGSGLNLFAVDALAPDTYRRFADALTFNFELLLDLIRRRVRFAYVPITWREEDQTSNARNWNVFVTALRVLARWRIGLPSAPVRAGARYEAEAVA